MTPVLSLDGFQESVSEVWPTALVVSAVGIDGGVVSVVELPETGVAMSVWIAAAERAVL